MQNALEMALANGNVTLRQLDGLIAVPSLSHPHFMEAHHIGIISKPNAGILSDICSYKNRIAST